MITSRETSQLWDRPAALEVEVGGASLWEEPHSQGDGWITANHMQMFCGCPCREQRGFQQLPSSPSAKLGLLGLLEPCLPSAFFILPVCSNVHVCHLSVLLKDSSF